MSEYSRRRFLSGIAATGGVAALAGCGEDEYTETLEEIEPPTENAFNATIEVDDILNGTPSCPAHFEGYVENNEEDTYTDVELTALIYDPRKIEIGRGTEKLGTLEAEHQKSFDGPTISLQDRCNAEPQYYSLHVDGTQE